MVTMRFTVDTTLGLIINLVEREVEIKRKVRDFDEDLQDKF